MNINEVEFLKKHPTYAFNAISSFYQLNGEQLRKYRDVLFWDDICENQEIEWSAGLIQTFLKYFKDKKGKLKSALHYNDRLTWSVEFIKQFEKLWHWDILGERDDIQDSSVIQSEFQKYLEPVNAWIASLKRPEIKRPDTNFKVDNFSDNNYSAEIKYLSLSEVEIQKHDIEWPSFSVDERTCDWDFEFLNAFESYIDFGMLCGNRKAWGNCFGKLTEEEINGILGDSVIQAQVVYFTPEIKMNVIERSHYEIPKCRTFEYFLKSYSA